jgi:hypothetical protein
MTFYEAALNVLEREGKPLHVSAIVERALKENLLSHVGKSPEDVMQSRLLAMARRRSERKIMATARQTYALTDWGMTEDPAALEEATEAPKRESESPLRPRERHPVPSSDKIRVAGRGGDRLRRTRREEGTEERRRRRRQPSLPEVVLELLSQSSGPMSAVDLAAAARERDLVSEDLGTEALLAALRDENRRRVDSGRKAAFSISPTGEVSAERAAAEAEAPAIGLVSPRREERGPGANRIMAQALEQRRQVLRLVRRRLNELDVFAMEKAGQALLDASGFRDAKTARRGRDAFLITARKREGVADLRYAILLKRGGLEVTREDVEEMRRDLTHFGAQLGILMSAGEASREARHAAQASGQAVVVLLCGDALAERYLEKRLGCASTMVEVFDLDDDFFRRCRERGRGGEERKREERGRRPGTGGQPASEPESAGEGHEASSRSARASRDPSAESRRREEEEIRAAAHERIEAAELQARLKPNQGSTAA